MAGPIKGYTANYNFALIEFDYPAWGDTANNNTTLFDATLATLIGQLNLQGVWLNSNAVTVGERWIDDTTYVAYEVLINHTTDAAPKTFATYRSENPTYYRSHDYVPRNRGVIADATVYLRNELVTNAAGDHVAMMESSYTTSGDPDPDTLFAAELAASRILTVWDATQVTIDVAAVAADLLLTNADVVSTNADVVLTNADVVLTNADVVLTGLDVGFTNADVLLTNADVLLTNADVVLTNADVVLTGLDVGFTNADVILTNADVVLTNADVVLTGLDVAACALLAANLAGTSTTSITIGAGSHVFTTQASKFFDVGQTLYISSDAAPTVDFMSVIVTAYSGTTLTVTAVQLGGSGAHTDWSIRLAGKDGLIGLTGATGADSHTTGDVKETYKTTADSGWVMMDDGTMGNASSGGTTRANADTENLFTLFWDNMADAECPVSTGRGASAAADFAANKNIGLPLVLGRALGISGAGSGLTSRVLGLSVGEEDHAPTEAEMRSHFHSMWYDIVSGTGAQSMSSRAASYSTGMSSIAKGGNSAANVMQPTSFINVMVKL